ncbi:hypothetical protein ACH4GK_08485 [Streptomyces rimosus]|uniref:hypothetical protein n=1 Tax=Streptomyces rimosus TaxID=1927 RepID=UPI000A85354A|nr:hypothetical protein [Streptomyces rimosus]
MALFRRRPPVTPISNEERNIRRLLNPPRPTLRDRLLSAAYAVEELWHRRVSYREIYRILDRARLSPDWNAPVEGDPQNRP